jgi:hypothetical protein
MYQGGGSSAGGASEARERPCAANELQPYVGYVWYLPADEGGIGYSSQYSCPRALLEGMSTD